jgi:hypothetical protein
LTFSGAFATVITVTAPTNITLPTAGTIVTTTVTALASLSTVGTISSGVWNGTAVTVPFGGTGGTTFTAHGMLLGEGAAAFAAMPVCATGTYFRGVTALDPICSTLTLPNAATTGDLMVATGANAIGSLADVATGQVLVSGGVGAVPAFSATPTVTSLTATGTVQAATVNFTTGVQVNGSLAFANGTPSLNSGFCTSPGLVNGTSTSFEWNVGTACATATGVINIGATAAHGWSCATNEVTTPDADATTQIASSTTTVTFRNYARNTGAATNWTASDHIIISCTAY